MLFACREASAAWSGTFFVCSYFLSIAIVDVEVIVLDHSVSCGSISTFDVDQ